MKISKGFLVDTVTVVDPDTKGDVEVSIFKDESSGGMFGVDSSYLEQGFEDGEDVQIKSPFDDDNLILLFDADGVML